MARIARVEQRKRERAAREPVVLKTKARRNSRRAVPSWDCVPNRFLWKAKGCAGEAAQAGATCGRVEKKSGKQGGRDKAQGLRGWGGASRSALRTNQSS